ncbi:DUF499 domain-containing protein [Nostoc sp.]|uniref:DUF499 domain-containing protein n=1 Tax=Nostoc sp. TaxID=1180 RepID=UPI002FF550AD
MKILHTAHNHLGYPTAQIPDDRRSMFTPLYGLTHFYHLFTPRQLVALNTFCELVSEVREKILSDALTSKIPDDSLPLCEGGKGATAYADAVATYLAIAVDRMSDYSSTICSWNSGRDNIRNTFARQAIPMTWDFAEVNPLSESTGNFIGAVDWIAKVVEISPCSTQGFVQRIDATKSDIYAKSIVVSTDPPYYDNIGYADLSEFFYVWLRRSLNFIYPDLFSTIIIPDKERELVATPYRFGGSKQKAKEFFETGLGETFKRMREMAHDGYPLTVYYAFKQTETDDEVSLTEAKGNSESRASTGWETMLEGLIKAGFSITGTWPMRTERSARSISIGTNALASSIALVCRPRPDVASGSYQQAEFAADLWQVYLDEGSDEYRIPTEFFSRTFLTEGLKQLLTNALLRLASNQGDPVIELQTNFGGGKTHAMLALYHLFMGVPASKLPGLEPVLEAANVLPPPKVNTAVLVGNKISPGQPQHKKDGTVVRTLWGELAWQLGGREAYDMIREADETSTNPGDPLRLVFNRYAPCLILIDELGSLCPTASRNKRPSRGQLRHSLYLCPDFE